MPHARGNYLKLGYLNWNKIPDSQAKPRFYSLVVRTWDSEESGSTS